MKGATSDEGAPTTAPLPSFWDIEKAAALESIALEAGAAIMQVRHAGSVQIIPKDDGSPVTQADLASERIILQALARLTPDIPVISEEQAADKDQALLPFCWLVDPLDSTRDFITGGNQFSVNIGLLSHGVPVLGAVYAPAQDDLFYGDPVTGVYRARQGTRTRLAPLNETTEDKLPRLVTSLRDSKTLPIQAWIEAGLIQSWLPCQSAYKLGLLAAGEVDLFIRTGATYEWDTAAGHAFLLALGGQIVLPDGTPLSYGKPELRNGAFLACRPGMDSAKLSHFFSRMTLGPQPT